MFVTINLRKFKKYIVFPFLFLMVILVAFLGLTWYYPLKYVDVIKENAKKYDLEPALICAVIHAESKFVNNAISNKGANGLMQVIEKTGNWAADEIGLTDFDYNTQILDEEVNIEIGSWYLRKLINQYGTLDLALTAYNAGSGNTSKWLKDISYSDDGVSLKVIPYNETKQYIKRVNFNYKVYKFILSFN